MNIFYLDEDIKLCAQYHVENHVRQMIRESAQLLSTACRMNGLDVGYKITHKNHPSAVWARASLDHWLWLKDLALALDEENQFRQRHTRSHASAEVIRSLPIPDLPKIGFVPPPKCMPDDCKVGDTVESYRNYYRKHKKHIAKWKNRPIPEWYNEVSISNAGISAQEQKT